MLEASVVVRFLGCLALASLAGSLLLDLLDRATPFKPPPRRAVLASGSVLLIALQIAIAAAQASPDDGFFAWRPIMVFTTETWSGGILATRLLVSGILAIWFLWARNRWLIVPWILAIFGLELIPLSGHASTAEPAALSMVMHGLHVAAALLWFGSLVNLALLTRQGDRAFRSALSSFSPLALGLISIAIVAGTAAGILQVESFAALLGTDYGIALLIKAAVLLPVAMAAAGWLRLVYLKRSHAQPPRMVLSLEALAGVGMLLLAGYMSQSVPSRHDDIVWPLDFRFNWNLALTADAVAPILIFSLIAACALAIVAAMAGTKRQRIAAVLAGCLAANIAAIGLAAIKVAAFPTSFAATPEAFSADRLMQAEATFQHYCKECHGESGNGEGELMQQVESAAADLTAMHTRDHTAGDMFWWISYGQPAGIMPGFAAEIGDNERWDLVNYVRLLTLSARSTELGDVSPLTPGLPSIDFGFSDLGGNYHALRDFEDSSAILLVLTHQSDAPQRLAEINAAMTAIEKANVTVIFVCDEWCAAALTAPVESDRLLIVGKGNADIFKAWAYYRRTASLLDRENLDPYVGHMEFLIDRYGYVRGRWRADDGLFPSVVEIIRQAEVIQNEPKLLPSPEEHVH